MRVRFTAAALVSGTVALSAGTAAAAPAPEASPATTTDIAGVSALNQTLAILQGL